MMSRQSAVGSRQSAVGGRQSAVWAASLLALAFMCTSVWAQGRGGVASFPAQQRDPADPAVVARGRAIYDTECRSCHGADLRGGEQRRIESASCRTLVLNDREGELLQPVLQGSHKERLSPAGLSADDVKALAAYIHSVLALAPGQGAPPPGTARRAQGARRRRRRRRAIFRGEVRELPLRHRRSERHRRARSRRGAASESLDCRWTRRRWWRRARCRRRSPAPGRRR